MAINADLSCQQLFIPYSRKHSLLDNAFESELDAQESIIKMNGLDLTKKNDTPAPHQSLGQLG